MEFFSRDKEDETSTQTNQSIIDFMNNNANETVNDDKTEEELNKEIQQKFRPKSNWNPNPPNRTLDLFQRSVKQEILKSKVKKRHFNNLTKEEKKGLKRLQ